MSDVPIYKKSGHVIAIDGPAGAGKSTTTKALSEKLGYLHVDTGSLYRAAALACLNAGVIDEKDLIPSQIPAAKKDAVIQTVRNSNIEMKVDKNQKPSNRVFLNGKDITQDIRTPLVSMATSRTSAIADVRAALLGLQRKLGCSTNSILEGRDIGTIVFPDADVKIYLTASPDVRAKRRWEELSAHNKDVPSLEQIKAQIIERDRGDSTREAAPLKKANDAVEFDTSEKSLNTVIEELSKLIKERL